MKVHMFKNKEEAAMLLWSFNFYRDRLGTPKERSVNLNIRNFLIRNS